MYRSESCHGGYHRWGPREPRKCINFKPSHHVTPASSSKPVLWQRGVRYVRIDQNGDSCIPLEVLRHVQRRHLLDWLPRYPIIGSGASCRVPDSFRFHIYILYTKKNISSEGNASIFLFWPKWTRLKDESWRRRQIWGNNDEKAKTRQQQQAKRTKANGKYCNLETFSKAGRQQGNHKTTKKLTTDSHPDKQHKVHQRKHTRLKDKSSNVQDGNDVPIDAQEWTTRVNDNIPLTCSTTKRSMKNLQAPTNFITRQSCLLSVCRIRRVRRAQAG